MDRQVLIPNFWNVGNNGDKSLTTDDLGWSEMIKQDAQSDYPERIFRYVVEEVGLNILFYWLKDRQWYTIETESSPIEVRRLFPNPNWDGKSEYTKAGTEGFPKTSAKGEIIAAFEDPSDLWDHLKIEGVRIGDVLEDSVITDLD